MTDVSIVAVVTPVFNRSKEVEALFKSLCLQDDDRFTWYVVDYIVT